MFFVEFWNYHQHIINSKEVFKEEEMEPLFTIKQIMTSILDQIAGKTSVNDKTAAAYEVVTEIKTGSKKVIDDEIWGDISDDDDDDDDVDAIIFQLLTKGTKGESIKNFFAKCNQTDLENLEWLEFLKKYNLTNWQQCRSVLVEGIKKISLDCIITSTDESIIPQIFDGKFDYITIRGGIKSIEHLKYKLLNIQNNSDIDVFWELWDQLHRTACGKILNDGFKVIKNASSVMALIQLYAYQHQSDDDICISSSKSIQKPMEDVYKEISMSYIIPKVLYF